MKLVEEEKSELEELLQREGFKIIGISEGRIYKKKFNEASELYFTVPIVGEGIRKENLRIEVSYIVNGLKTDPKKISLYQQLGLREEIPYSLRELEKIIKNFPTVI